MLFLWFYHACRRNAPRFLMVSDHINYLTFEDPGAVNTVRRALKLAHAGDLYGAAETAGVDVAHAAVVSEGLRRGMRYSIGAEVDNDPRARPDAQNIVDAMRPDGIIRSVHFLTIDHPEKGGEFAWNFDNPEFVSLYDHVGIDRVWELYMARLLDDIEKLPGHVVGHFYVPAKFGHWPDAQKLDEYENKMLEAAAARGMAVEINTRLLYRETPDELKEQYLEANRRLARKCKARGVGIAIGSDAHSPKDQGNGFDVILKLLDECEINEIVFPVGGRLARVALRATKEHIEAQAQQKTEPVQPGSSISGLSRAELGLPEEPEPKPEERRAKSVREAGPKKRTGGPARSGSGSEASEDSSEPKSSPKRTADSEASSKRAKAAKGRAAESKAETDVPAAPDSAEGSAITAKPKTKAGSSKSKTAAQNAAQAPEENTTPAPAPKAVAKPAAKTPPAKPSVPKTQSKTAAKPAAAKASPAKAAVKAAAKPVAKSTAKPAAKSAAPAKAVKPAAKTAAKPVAKKSSAPAKKVTAAKAPAKKAAAVKPSAKKSAKPAAKKAAVKQSAPAKKSTTKLAAAKKKAVAKPAAKKAAPKKTAVTRPVKKTAAKSAAKGTSAKKKTTTKRR